jgi:hypothetical protein
MFAFVGDVDETLRRELLWYGGQFTRHHPAHISREGRSSNRPKRRFERNVISGYSRHQCGCSHSHRLTHSRMYKLIIEGSLRRFPEDKQ